MPDIKEDNVLLSLCHQIEESEILQYKLERLLDDRSEELAKNRSSKKMLTILCVVLLLSTLMLLIYTIFSTRDKEIMVENNDLSLFRSDINILKGDLEELKKNDTNIKNLKDLYLYRSLIKKDTVYSVQIQSFKNEKIKVVSKKFTNALFYQDNSYYKISLGIFETLPEAQEFRKILLQSSIMDKNIFVISYKEGKRLQIEDPF